MLDVFERRCMMLSSSARIGWLVCRQALSSSLPRSISMSAPCCQQAAAATDPIQKMFIDKIHEYAQKSKASGGKLVDASPAVEKELVDELEKITRVYGAKSEDFTKFPTFNFTDPELQAVGLGTEFKPADASAEAEHAEEEEEEDDRPYWEAP